MERKIKFLIAGCLCVLLMAMPITKLCSAKTTKLTVQLQIGKTKVTKKTYKLEAGKTKTLKALATKKISSVEYTSSDNKVASVSKEGVIKAKKAGTAKITAVVKTKQGSKTTWVNVKVTAKKTKPDSTSKPSGSGNILVVYFTRTGNTKMIADIISEKTGGTKVRLETEKKYSSDYGSVYDEALEELNTNARPKLKTKIENMDTYDAVFVGYPIWHGDAPMAIRSFLEEYDFTGKKVIPFCTSASSRPDTSFASIKELAQGAKILDGFWSNSSGLGDLEETVPKWLEGLDIAEKKTEGNKMKITAGDTVFTATLADNSSAAALKELLAKGPLTIDMSDYGDMEKVGPIGTSLPANDERIVTEAGDIILYQGDSLVIYYDTNTWNFTRIGKIGGVTKKELLKALGDGDVTVTFSLE